MRVLQLKRLYLPALSIVAAVAVLLVLIGISTYRNLDREKKNALQFLHREGVALLRSLEAGARAGMMMPMWHDDAVGGLIHEIGRSENIAFVYLFDTRGVVMHHSDPSKQGGITDWNPSATNGHIVSRVLRRPDGSPVYELAKRFEPLPSIHEGAEGRSMMMGKGHMRIPHRHRNATLVLGLKMTAFEEARRADLHHAVIMAGILLVLGTGTLFFIFVIQNYYLVDKTLRETKGYTAQVIANMANGLLSVDLHGEVVSYNQLALNLLGLEESRIKGVNLRHFIDFQASGIEETMTHCRAILEREIQYEHGTGDKISLALSVTPILGNEAECKGAVIILRDLREIKRLEEEVRRAEKLAAIGKLAAGVAHEIRNPLSSIRGFAQFLRHALADRPKEQEYADIMIREVDRINKVVTDLLTFSSPMEVESAPTDLRELIEHTVRLVEADAQSRGVTIQKEMSADLPEIKVDTNQMTQAMLNLLLNGLQASEAGGRISVGAAMDRLHGRLCLWVEDDGHGIAREHRDNIFDPFFTTRQKGTGLGLAIVHKIVENHRGEIRVDSPPAGKGRGTRFSVYVPLQE